MGVVLYGEGMGQGDVFAVTKTFVSSGITTAMADITGVSSVGTILIEDIILKTDGSTGLATGTNLQISTNNAKGGALVMVTAVSGLGISKTIDGANASVSKTKVVLETGKKLTIDCTAADCTGAGTVDVTLICRRLASGAALAAA